MILSITGDIDGLYNIDTLGTKTELTTTVQFSEPITGLIANNILEITGTDITNDLNFNNGNSEATLTIGIATKTQATLTLDIGDYSDLAGNNNIETTYDSPQVYIIDNVRPFIESSTDIALPITNNTGFTFTLTFSDDISIDTFTAEDFTVEPEELASISDIAFSGTTATITATTDIPETATGNLTISVGDEWKDTADNTADKQILYTIDVQLPTVKDTDSEPIETTPENDYTITYTFSESRNYNKYHRIHRYQKYRAWKHLIWEI